MLRWLLRRKLAQEEQKLGESLDYLRHILDVSVSAFLRFASFMPLANSRKTLPTGDEDELRETLRQRYGERGLIELAYAIASSQIPPTVKRCLGYARSCRLVHVEVGH